MSEALVLRTATPADAAAIRALTRDAYAKWVPLIGREPKPMGADYAAALARHRFELLCQGEDIVALIELIPGPDHLLIENVAVAPGFQHRGLGRRLLAHAEALTRAAGHAEIRLYTNAKFVENLRLYESLGYQVEREEVLPLGSVIHMRKSLTAG